MSGLIDDDDDDDDDDIYIVRFAVTFVWFKGCKWLDKETSSPSSTVSVV